MSSPEDPSVDRVAASQSKKGQYFPARRGVDFRCTHLNECRLFATWTKRAFPGFQKGIPGELASSLHRRREGPSSEILARVLVRLVVALPLEAGRQRGAAAG